MSSKRNKKTPKLHPDCFKVKQKVASLEKQRSVLIEQIRTIVDENENSDVDVADAINEDPPRYEDAPPSYESLKQTVNI